MFVQKHFDLGKLRLKTKHKIIFRFDSSVTKINRVTTSCGCTLLDTDTTGRQIIIDYSTPKTFPSQFEEKHMTSYKTTKQIIVFFEELSSPGIEQQETLTFSAHIQKGSI